MDSAKSDNIIVHDIRGQICPSCLLTALQEVNKQRDALKNHGLRIIIKTDNRDATSTIPEAVKSMGYIPHVEKKEGFYIIEISSKPRT